MVEGDRKIDEGSCLSRLEISNEVDSRGEFRKD